MFSEDDNPTAKRDDPDRDVSAAERALAAIQCTDELLDLVLRMTPKEREFVESLSERIDKYGERTFVSPKQLEWLEALVSYYLEGKPRSRRSK